MRDRRAHVVVGLGFGDEGKGSVVDSIVRRTGADLVVRFNGGGNAAHNVVTPDGRHHAFSQFGAGTFVPGCRTALSRFVVFHPTALIEEARHLREVGVDDAMARLTVDPRCLVTTPYQQAVNRLREIARGAGRHGSCGAGLGETVRDAAGDYAIQVSNIALDEDADLRVQLKRIRDSKRMDAVQVAPEARAVDQAAALREFEIVMDKSDEVLENTVRAYRRVVDSITIANVTGMIGEAVRDVVFEGAQGILLDENFGFHPHTTWSTCTSANALRLIRNSKFDGGCEVIGVVRSFATRHGAGPFPAESTDAPLRFEHNGDGAWQGPLRRGWFDAVLTRYAIDCDGHVDSLALTHLDARPDRLCVAYDEGGRRTLHLNRPRSVEEQEALTRRLAEVKPIMAAADRRSAGAFEDQVRDLLHRPVSITSFGPRADYKSYFPSGQ